MTRTRPIRLALALLVAVPFVVLGCNETIRSMLQSKINEIWLNPARNAQVEQEFETKLDQALESELGGQELEVPGPNPYVHHVYDCNVELGTSAPQVSIPGTAQFWQTSTNYYLSFSWAVNWAAPNGAAIDFTLDLRPVAWYIPGYPDHTIHIRNISASGSGSAFVVIPKNGSQGVASVSVGSATVNLTAQAEGWFWTFDVSSMVRSKVNDLLVRQAVGKSISLAFNAQM
ncbi:MAG: hypothetical protein HY720_32140 [Planctomycetes bacterium]|nr:hypothetical protein [Planctomycetota bacterium]